MAASGRTWSRTRARQPTTAEPAADGSAPAPARYGGAVVPARSSIGRLGLAGLIEAVQPRQQCTDRGVVVNAAGCGSTIKEYGHQLRDEPEWAEWAERAEALARKSRDINEFIVEIGPVAERHPLPTTVAYQDACHLAHAQGIREEPRKLLRGIPGVELKQIAEAELCCGSAGTYNMLQPEPARELGERRGGQSRTPSRCSTPRSAGCPSRICSSGRSPVPAQPWPGPPPRTGE